MGIGFKLGLFVALILSTLMLISGLFVVRQQEGILEKQLRRDLASHLQAYRIAASGSLSGPEDVGRLQSYTYALTNINHFSSAMFVDPRGRIFAQVDTGNAPFDGRQAFVTMPLPKLDDPELAARYPDIGYLLSDMTDETNVVFVRSSRYTASEYQKVLAESKRNKSVAPENTAWFEGFLPVYVNWLLQVNEGDSSLKTALALYRQGVERGFAFSGQQSEQRRRDLSFLGYLETAARWLAIEKFDAQGQRTGWELSPYARLLASRGKDGLLESESQQLIAMLPLIEKFRQGTSASAPAEIFPRQLVAKLAGLLERVYATTTKPEGLSELLKDAHAGALFQHGSEADEVAEIRLAADWLKVSRVLTRSSGPDWNKVYGEMTSERLVKPFLAGDEIFVDIALFAGLFEAYLKTGVFPLPASHRYQKLARVYQPGKNQQERAEFIRHILRSLVTPFKFGYVRVILDPGAIRSETLKVVSETVDISLALVVRAVILAVLFAGVFVRNIKRLAAAAVRVGQGDLETQITISSRDELGRLARQFNNMVSEIRASQAALVEKSRMEEELRIAESIQQGLLPANFPEVSGYAFAGYYSAQTEAGGDYYDVLDRTVLGGNLVGLVSADVSGHGVGAGLVMTMLRTLLHAQAVGNTEPARVLSRINPQLFRDTPATMFVTAFYAVLDCKKHQLIWSSAGHNPALCCRGAKGVERLTSAGIPLGMADGPTFESIIGQGQSQLSAGDVLLLYTDGVTEAMNSAREEYAEERLANALQRVSGLAPQEIVSALVEDLASFTGGLPQEDDISLLVVKRLKR